jgi:hypothetical protein
LAERSPLSCTGAVSVTGAPDSGTGSIFLIDGASYQDVAVDVTCTLSAGADNAGVVVGYVDSQNFWALIKSKAQQKMLYYQVAGGTWTLHASSNTTVTAGTPFSLDGFIGAGHAGALAGTVPAGQVGLWCSHGTDNSFDNFLVRDVAGPFEVDGRWFCNLAAAQVDASDSNVLEARSTSYMPYHLVRRGFRGDKYVATFKFKWNGTSTPGFWVRWLWILTIPGLLCG